MEFVVCFHTGRTKHFALEDLRTTQLIFVLDENHFSYLRFQIYYLFKSLRKLIELKNLEDEDHKFWPKKRKFVLYFLFKSNWNASELVNRLKWKQFEGNVTWTWIGPKKPGSTLPAARPTISARKSLRPLAANVGVRKLSPQQNFILFSAFLCVFDCFPGFKDLNMLC